MPTFFPAASSGANSCTERESVLNNFNPMKPQNVSARTGKLKVLTCGEHKRPFVERERFPHARAKFAKFEAANPHAHQSQGRMTNSRGHPPDLTVLALDEFERDPAVGNIFAKTNRRVARRNLRLRIEQPRA